MMSDSEQSKVTGPDQSDSSPAGADEKTTADLSAQLEKANQTAQEYLSLAQRTQADLVNYRRRVEQERGESLNAGKTMIVMRILPVLDDFERALKARPADVPQNDW